MLCYLLSQVAKCLPVCDTASRSFSYLLFGNLEGHIPQIEGEGVKVPENVKKDKKVMISNEN